MLIEVLIKIQRSIGSTDDTAKNAKQEKTQKGTYIGNGKCSLQFVVRLNFPASEMT